MLLVHGLKGHVSVFLYRMWEVKGQMLSCSVGIRMMEDELLGANQSSLLLLLHVDQERFPCASWTGVSLISSSSSSSSFSSSSFYPCPHPAAASPIIATWKMIGAAGGRITEMVQLTLTKQHFFFCFLSLFLPDNSLRYLISKVQSDFTFCV